MYKAKMATKVTMKILLVLFALLHSVSCFVVLHRNIDTGGRSQCVFRAVGNSDKEAAAAIGKEKLKKMKGDLNVNPVTAGGWYNLQLMAADPKGALVNLIVESCKNDGGDYDSGKFEGLLALLEAQGKGFSSDLVDGEWAQVLNKSGKKSPTIQKMVAKREEVGKTFANFDVKESKFFGSVKLFRGLGVLRSTVRFRPVGTGFSKVQNVIVLRRIMCDIIGASLKIWKLPRIPLPLRRKGGYLDFVYLDEDIRVTRGSRGGVFVHFRPEFLDKVMQ